MNFLIYIKIKKKINRIGPKLKSGILAYEIKKNQLTIIIEYYILLKKLY